jgi:hypothetical protein
MRRLDSWVCGFGPWVSGHANFKAAELNCDCALLLPCSSAELRGNIEQRIVVTVHHNNLFLPIDSGPLKSVDAKQPIRADQEVSSDLAVAPLSRLSAKIFQVAENISSLRKIFFTQSVPSSSKAFEPQPMTEMVLWTQACILPRRRFIWTGSWT